MAGEELDIVESFAQRGQVHWEDVEAVVEVLAEGAGLGQVEQPAIGRRDNAHIDALDARGAHRLDLALLQSAQKLGLGVER